MVAAAGRNVEIRRMASSVLSASREMAEEYKAAGDRRYESVPEDFSTYLEHLSNASRGVNLSPGIVPESSFWLVQNNRLLGRSKLRHWLNPVLEHEGGHIGYDIRPSERRKGYGTLILDLTLDKDRSRGLRSVLLTAIRITSGRRK